MTIDIDDASTWPVDVSAAVDEVVTAHDGFPDAEDWDEVHLTAEDREVVDDAIQDLSLMGYHATRLLDHEVQSVRSNGLVPLSPEATLKRLDVAVEVGALPPALADLLRPGAVSTSSESNRTNQVCLTSSRDALRSRRGFWRLLTYWGGEAIYWHRMDGDPVLSTLAQIGRGAVVSASIPIDQVRQRSANVDVAQALVAKRLGIQMGGSIFLRELPPSHISDVILEGSAEWNVLAPLSAL